MKKALVIGINYRHTANELHGCINDALNMCEFLKKHEFKDITLMTDNSETALLPNSDNLIREMSKLVSSSKSGDHLFLSYSGHGASVRDVSGDERDGKDETIVPLDMKLIIDDDLRKILVDALPEGVKLAVLFDCCHSGTGLDLRYNYTPVGGNKGRKRFVIDMDKNYKESKGYVVLFSGCSDPDYSADTVFNNQAQGAMTHAFLSLVENGLSYIDMLNELRKFMKKNGYSQVPQLSSGKLLNLSEKFEL